VNKDKGMEEQKENAAKYSEQQEEKVTEDIMKIRRIRNKGGIQLMIRRRNR
jgi:hypothetical protein